MTFHVEREPVWRVCDDCDGEGHDNTPEYDPHKCQKCDGWGGWYVGEGDDE